MMKTQPSSIQKLVVQLRAELLADKKKTVIMGGLLAVAAVMGLRMFGGKVRPASATVPSASSIAAAPSATATTGAHHNTALDTYLAQMDRRVSRDLFAVDFDAYPEASVVAKPAPDEGSRKPAVDPTAVARLALEVATRRDAEQLHLQSTMPGGTPSAIINGQVVRVGQTFEGFEIRSIGQGSCVVARGAVEVTLRMNP